MNQLADLASLVGRSPYDGSSVQRGVPYQNIPFSDIPFHRGKSDWRAKRICELVNVRGMSVLDLGCSVGTMSAVFADRGAYSVVGVDHDEDSLNLGKAAYGDKVKFVKADITKEFIDGLEHYDIIVWTSQFMWMVKQHGMNYALDALYSLSIRCQVLVFETAGAGDGLAPMDAPVLPMLVKNTCFQEILDCGPWGDEWTTRNVYVCKKPVLVWDTNPWTMVKREDRQTIAKVYKTSTIGAEHVDRMKEIKGREEYFLWLLNGSKFFPTILSTNDNSIFLKYEGIPAVWLPESDLTEIHSRLRKRNVIHRDIRPENLVWNGENCVLLDFSYAIHDTDITNYHYDLGGSFKSPHGFNDEFSLRKTQLSLMLKSLERENKQ